MSIGVWSIVAILYESFLFIILSWLTLGCRLAPHAEELHEVTLMKLLYLYDPVACGRIHFYNFTTFQSKTNARLTTAVIWPINNDVASRFRSKIQVWLTIHLIWAILAVTYVSLGNRPCAFYVALLPFTATGVSLLIVDLVFAGLFIDDSKNTGTETAILQFINNNKGNLRSVNTTINISTEQDTSWISLLMAYVSCRGVVQWIFNFWIVKDTYFEGVAAYHNLQYQTKKAKLSAKSSQHQHHIEV